MATFTFEHNTTKVNQVLYKYCKVIPTKSLTSYRVVVLDMCIRKFKEILKKLEFKDLWWSLQREKAMHFKDKILKEENQYLNREINTIWEELANSI